VIAPNGIIAHLFGPIEGRGHDAFMLAESKLIPLLERIVKPNGDPYVFYGDRILLMESLNILFLPLGVPI
jgi:hypothetical protein